MPDGPRHYESIEGWFDFADLYTGFVQRYPSGSHFVEVGAWKGKSTCYMAESIRASGKAIRFDAVDTWQGSVEHDTTVAEIGGGDRLFLEFLRNMQSAGVLTAITPVRLPSSVAVQLYEDRSLDLVFIDASHEYQDVRADVLAWRPKIKPGGILAGHDYNPMFPGVIQAVDEIFGGQVDRVGCCWSHDVSPGQGQNS